VFRGRVRRWLTWLVFILLTVAFVANLAAYVSGAGEIVANLTGFPARAAEPAVYVVAAGVVFFGLKAVGVAEKFGALGLVVFVAVLAAGAAGVRFRLEPGIRGGTPEGLALWGVVMYGYYAFFTVPQVVEGLAPDRRRTARAIVAGLAVNGLLMAAVALIALGVSREVTELAITGVADVLGSWAKTVGSPFILFALVTSYWSVSPAPADIIRERAGLHRRTAWVLATLPSLLLLSVEGWAFLEWLRLAAGATAIVIALITIPMYLNARRIGEVRAPEWSLGRWGGPVMLGLAFVATVLMAAGSFLEI
jgi:amino acid permease